MALSVEWSKALGASSYWERSVTKPRSLKPCVRKIIALTTYKPGNPTDYSKVKLPDLWRYNIFKYVSLFVHFGDKVSRGQSF